MSNATPNGSPIAATLPVVAVRLLEDRAHVTRRGTITLSPGAFQLRVAEVAPVLADRTLVALGRGAGRVIDARVDRTFRAHRDDHPETLRDLIQEIERCDDEIASIEAQRRRVQARLTATSAAAEHELLEIVEEASYGEALDDWSSRIEAQHRAERELTERLLPLNLEFVKAKKKRQSLQTRLKRASHSPARSWSASLLLDVILSHSGELEIEITYVVPGACWRPAHAARLIEGDTPSVAWTALAFIWQHTGEDWNDVELSFGTERPSLGMSPPLLAEDELRTQRRAETIQVDVREHRDEKLGLGRGAPAAEGIPGIDDGGASTELVAPQRASVPSDGRPHRVELFSLEGEAELGLVLMAELSPGVTLRSRQTNTASQPLLAGPVELIRGGGLVGRTQILFVSPGERFQLGWGPDADVRVQREQKELDPEDRALSSFVQTRYRVQLWLSNLGAEQKRIEVLERMPVSEIESVRVELDSEATTGAPVVADSGIVTWTPVLEPLRHRRLALGYTIARHHRVTGA